MIDQQVFLRGITLMSNHYDRKLAPEVLGIWKEYLDKVLTTEQFQQAVKMTILSSRFFPTAKELVEAIKGDEGVQAQQEWEVCIKAAVREEYSIADSLTPQGKFALRAVGGVSELGRTNSDELRWAKKEFISAWKGWKPTAGSALLPAADKSALPEGVGCEVARQMRSLTQKMTLNGRANNSAPPSGLRQTATTEH